MSEASTAVRALELPRVRHDGAPAWMRATPVAPRLATFGARTSSPETTAAPKPSAPPPPPSAEQLLAAREQAIAAQESALEAARQELEAARAEVEAERATWTERCASIAADAEAAVREAGAVPDDLVAPILELALGVAEAILGAALETDAALHAKLAEAALGAVERGQATEVRASAASYAAIVEHVGAPRMTVDGVDVPVVLDSTLSGAGVIACVGPARIEGRVAERLARVREAWREEGA